MNKPSVNNFEGRKFSGSIPNINPVIDCIPSKKNQQKGRNDIIIKKKQNLISLRPYSNKINTQASTNLVGTSRDEKIDYFMGNPKIKYRPKMKNSGVIYL